MRVEDLGRLGPAAQKQILAKLRAQNEEREQAAQKKSKYRNEKDSRGSLKFDSKKEARRFDELMLLLRAGEIRDLRLQQDYTLQEAYTTPEGERIRAIRYKADFVYERRVRMTIHESRSDFSYEDESWVKVVEDTKSNATKTKDYNIKKKLMQEIFGVSITEV